MFGQKKKTAMKRPNNSGRHLLENNSHDRVESNRMSSNNSSAYPSYQKSTGVGLSSGTSYQAPIYYANDQTRILEETTKSYYNAEDTAGNVLQQMTQQRQQVVNAHDKVWDMRQATEIAKREIEELQGKYHAKKRRLYLYIGALSIIDILLFIRLIHCHGNFYCF
jgi:hypothetical protein